MRHLGEVLIGCCSKWSLRGDRLLRRACGLSRCFAYRFTHHFAHRLTYDGFTDRLTYGRFTDWLPGDLAHRLAGYFAGSLTHDLALDFALYFPLYFALHFPWHFAGDFACRHLAQRWLAQSWLAHWRFTQGCFACGLACAFARTRHTRHGRYGGGLRWIT
jgi:hypothetical protein